MFFFYKTLLLCNSDLHQNNANLNFFFQKDALLMIRLICKLLILNNNICGMAYAVFKWVSTNKQEDVMGYLIDMLFLVRELVKLAFMVIISPFGLAAGYLTSWQ